MLSYELAHQLKDAGFPLLKKRELIAFGEKTGYLSGLAEAETPDLSNDVEYLMPTLSELIAACGEHDFILHYLGHEKKWQASIIIPVLADTSKQIYDQLEYDAEGSNSEEAVANLWLAINKK